VWPQALTIHLSTSNLAQITSEGRLFFLDDDYPKCRENLWETEDFGKSVSTNQAKLSTSHEESRPRWMSIFVGANSDRWLWFTLFTCVSSGRMATWHQKTSQKQGSISIFCTEVVREHPDERGDRKVIAPQPRSRINGPHRASMKHGWSQILNNGGEEPS